MNFFKKFFAKKESKPIINVKERNKRMEEISKEYNNQCALNRLYNAMRDYFYLDLYAPDYKMKIVNFKYSGKFENNKWIIEIEYYTKLNVYNVYKKKKECVDKNQYDRIIYQLFEVCSNPHLGINQ